MYISIDNIVGILVCATYMVYSYKSNFIGNRNKFNIDLLAMLSCIVATIIWGFPILASLIFVSVLAIVNYRPKSDSNE